MESTFRQLFALIIIGTGCSLVIGLGTGALFIWWAIHHVTIN